MDIFHFSNPTFQVPVPGPIRPWLLLMPLLSKKENPSQDLAFCLGETDYPDLLGLNGLLLNPNKASCFFFPQCSPSRLRKATRELLKAFIVGVQLHGLFAIWATRRRRGGRGCAGGCLPCRGWESRNLERVQKCPAARSALKRQRKGNSLRPPLPSSHLESL